LVITRAHVGIYARAKYDETDEKKIVTNKLKEQIFSDDPKRTPSKMDGERSIIRNCVIITALFVPCVVIATVTALIYVVKVCLRVVKKLCAYIQREMDLFNEIHEDNEEPVWDEGGLFVAFIKGEDVHGRLQKRNTLRPKAQIEKKATIRERIYGGIPIASTVKRPMIGECFFRDILERPCADFRPYSGISDKSTLSYVRKSQDCTRIGASTLSDLIHPVTSDAVTDANLLHAVKGNKDHSHENTMVSLCANREDHCQVADVSSEVNLQQGRSLPCSRMSVLTAQNSEEKQVNLSQDIERSSFRADRKKKNGKTTKVACSNQVGQDISKEVKPQEINLSSFDANKGKKIIKPAKVGRSSEVGVNEKVEASQDIRRSSFAIKKRNKRRNAAASESVATEQLAKKKRKEPDEAPHPCKVPAPPSLKKMSKKRKTRRVSQSPTGVRQQKIVAVELRPNVPFIGQPELMKEHQKSAVENVIPVGRLLSANLQLQGTHREPTSVHNAGELLNAKRPLPVTPFSVEPAKESMDMDQESLPATPSMTELVSLMEKLRIATFLDPASDCVDDVSDSYSDDDNDGSENALFPELQTLGKQVQIKPSEDPASDYVADVSESESDVDSDDAEYALFPELQSLGEQVLQIIQLLP